MSDRESLSIDTLPDDLAYEHLSVPERVAREARVAAELARLFTTELSQEAKATPLAKIVGEDRGYRLTYDTLLQISEADSARELPSNSSSMVA